MSIAAAAVAALRRLHEAAEDVAVDRMPDDEELFRALLYLESHASALKEEPARREAAVARVRLWEYLREQADVHQAKAVEDARAAGAQWAELAPALAVNASSAAYNKAKRLRAVVLAQASADEGPIRRTPEAVRAAEQRAAARAAAERRAEVAAARRHSLLTPVARQLLRHRSGLTDDPEVAFWLDQVAAVLPSCRTPTQLVSLETYIEAVVREAHKAERTTGMPAARTAEARSALAAAEHVMAGGT